MVFNRWILWVYAFIFVFSLFFTKVFLTVGGGDLSVASMLFALLVSVYFAASTLFGLLHPKERSDQENAFLLVMLAYLVYGGVVFVFQLVGLLTKLGVF